MDREKVLTLDKRRNMNVNVIHNESNTLTCLLYWITHSYFLLKDIPAIAIERLIKEPCKVAQLIVCVQATLNTRSFIYNPIIKELYFYKSFIRNL